MKYEDIRVGDRFRCEAVVTQTYRHLHGAPTFEIDLGTLELIRPATTPGQRAYATYQLHVRNVSKPWSRLEPADQDIWEAVGAAARS